MSPAAVRYDAPASFSPGSTSPSPHHAPETHAVHKLPLARSLPSPSCRHGAGARVSLCTPPFYIGSRNLLLYKGRTRLNTFIEMLLLPGSALRAPPRTLTRALPRCAHARLLRTAPGASRPRSAPSILGSPRFDRYVASRFLPDSNLHGHRPTVLIWTPPLWALCPRFGRLSPC